ncbi:MAG: hypothetical protein NVS9B12_15050 [Vulcanimicrobiaceae bacterium]
MATTLVRNNSGGAGSAGPGSAGHEQLSSPFRNLMGLDPFRNFFSSFDAELEMIRTESGYEVGVPVPGYKPAQIDVTLQDGALNISGKNDRRYFNRTLLLPEDVDCEKIDARVEDGMLLLKLDRLPEAQPKKIQIKTSAN